MAKEPTVETQYIGTIKEFMNSAAWRDYLKPKLLEPIQREFPEPSEEGWEKKYIYVFALATVITSLISSIENTASLHEFKNRMKDILPIDEN